MKKFQLFIENILIYGLGGIISKIVPLVMLPIITRLMPNTFYFGLNDLTNTVISFGSYFAIMGMYDAMFRFFFDKEEMDEQRQICSTALSFTLATSVIVFLFLICLQKPISTLIYGDKRYGNLICLSAISILIGGTNSIISAPTRMQNKRKVYLVLNLVSPLVSYSVSVVLLVKGQFVYALPLASVISAFTCETIFYILNRKWFTLSKFSMNYLKKMLVIALPLFPNFLVYWVFNSCDRIMIGRIMGNEYTGIYAIGSKIGEASQLIYAAFAGGWQYFAFSTMKEKQQVQQNSMIYEYLGAISFIAAAYVAAISKPLFFLFFEGEYTKGYVVAPYLFLAPLLLMLYQVACNQFLVIKKTWPNIFILAFGAMANVIINRITIPIFGIEGAAFATLTGYIISNMLCMMALCRMKLMKISKRFLSVITISSTYYVLWRVFLRNHSLWGLLFATIMTISFGIFYFKEIQMLFRKRKVT